MAVLANGSSLRFARVLSGKVHGEMIANRPPTKPRPRSLVLHETRNQGVEHKPRSNTVLDSRDCAEDGGNTYKAARPVSGSKP